MRLNITLYVPCLSCFLFYEKAATLEEGRKCGDDTSDLTPNLCKSTGFLMEIYGPLTVFLRKHS